MKHVNKKLTELSTEMLYFKNPELARLYHVTLRTVLNWIEAAKQGKLDLTLHTEKGRSYIANTTKNTTTIKRLVEERKKYRNSRAVKVVTPRPEFYKLYNQAQIYEIVTNLNVHKEVPRQFNYFDGGAHNWDEYVRRLESEEGPNQLKSTIQLFIENRGYIDSVLFAKYKRINVVDIGVGNALPVREFLSHLLGQQKLGRYIALDISAEMLEIARANIEKWFEGKVEFEGYELDINYDRFANILATESLGGDAKDTLNLMLFLGGTPYNFRDPDGAFRIIRDSMDRNDLLIYTDKLDSEASRRYFDFNNEPGKTRLAPNHRFIFNLLNIDESFYDVEMGYDEYIHQRYIRVRLKVSLNIKFKFDMGERILELNKGEAILLWRFWQQSALDLERRFDKNGFYTLHSSQTADRQYIMTISQVKCE
ncbi:MAG TPA: L-histidine N(alpha)-methyltransferase [Candidatus Saccharimonadales bacterium]|nr:L-histidine N(alpha)-methyltransferase [Candidatus Saccharimonadales bacterium]